MEVTTGLEAERRAWLGDVSRTLAHASLDATPMVAVHVGSGRFLGATPAIRAVLGCDVPEHVDDLVSLGIAARPDVEHLRALVLEGSQPPVVAPLVGGESARNWTARLRIHPPGGPSRLVEVQAAHHRRPGLGAEVLWATITPAPGAGAQLDHEDRDGSHGAVPPVRFSSVLDRQARLVAISPKAAALWADLPGLLGTVATAMVHPEDLPTILPSANAVFSGAADRASYTARMAVDGGRWVALRVDVERVVTAGEHLLVLDNRVIDEGRRNVPVGLLSPREFAIVMGLFEGCRVAQIAARDGVAPKTIRNQLVGIYRKLGVAGQAELLATFHQPTRR